MHVYEHMYTHLWNLGRMPQKNKLKPVRFHSNEKKIKFKASP